MPALVYVVGTLAMVFTALSYGMLIREWPVSGSVYAYTSRGLGSRASGFVTGVDAASGLPAHPACSCTWWPPRRCPGLVPEVPPWAFAVAFVAAVTFVNVRGIALTDIVNRVALGAGGAGAGRVRGAGRALAADRIPASRGFTLEPRVQPRHVRASPLVS